jgi:hypothetical protein
VIWPPSGELGRGPAARVESDSGGYRFAGNGKYQFAGPLLKRSLEFNCRFAATIRERTEITSTLGEARRETNWVGVEGQRSEQQQVNV